MFNLPEITKHLITHQEWVQSQKLEWKIHLKRAERLLETNGVHKSIKSRWFTIYLRDADTQKKLLTNCLVNSLKYIVRNSIILSP